MLFWKKAKEMKKESEMKKAAPSNLMSQRSNSTPQGSNLMRPDAAEEELWAIAAQEEWRTLANQEERRAQAVRTAAQILVPAALVPAALVPTETARDLKAARDKPTAAQSAFRETPDAASVSDTDAASVPDTDAASVPSMDSASVPTPPSIAAFAPYRCPPARMIQEDGRALQKDSRALQENGRALQENGRALLNWYDEYAAETEQRQHQKAEDFADWQQGRSRVRKSHASSVSQGRGGGVQKSCGGSVLPRHASAPARPLPLRAGKRTPLGRAHQHWDTPEGRLLVQVRLGEAVLLPKMRAQNAGERGAVNARIAEALGLAAAAEAGVLTGFVVGWQDTGRWPRRPVAVQLFWPGGKAQGDRLRGKYGPLLVHLQEEARVHFNQAHFNLERP